MRREIVGSACLVLLSCSVVQAQLVFSAQSGGANGLFQQSAGGVTAITSGLSDNGFPSISRDGRLVVVSGPDPAQPAQASTDLWLIDRVAQTRNRIVNHSSTNLSGGAVATINPLYSHLSPDTSVVAVNDAILITSPSGNSVTPQLNLYRVSDGFYLDLVEQGRGDFSDLFRAEFIGISWKPDGSGFATPAYETYIAQDGQPRDLVGIQLFSYNALSGTATRQAVLSFPRSFNLQPGLPSETHIFPAFSPNGTRLAYFNIFWPNPTLTQPATATLRVANADGSGVVDLRTFPAGQYPFGLTWSSDGSRLVYAIANQVNQGGFWIASADPTTAQIWSIGSVVAGTPVRLSGVTAGYVPNLPRIDLLPTIDLSLAPQGDGTFLLQAFGLPGSASYGIESTTDVRFWGGRQNFTGAQFTTGLIVTPTTDIGLFRLVE